MVNLEQTSRSELAIPSVHPCRYCSNAPVHSAIKNPTEWLLLQLLRAGDIEQNPSPRRLKYPCQICDKTVKWGQQALVCDGCDAWSHAECLGMSTGVYTAL